MNESKTGMKLVFIVVLFLIILPLAIFALLRCFPPVPGESATSNASSATEDADTGRTSARERRARHENRAVREETTVVETADPEPFFEEVGAISPNAMRGKQATPYAPGTVPGDSGIVVNYAGSPDDGISGPEPIPPDDPWGGAVMPPMTPEQMRGIGGVRRIDPNDPFFQQDIPNPFER